MGGCDQRDAGEECFEKKDAVAAWMPGAGGARLPGRGSHAQEDLRARGSSVSLKNPEKWLKTLVACLSEQNPDLPQAETGQDRCGPGAPCLDPSSCSERKGPGPVHPTLPSDAGWGNHPTVCGPQGGSIPVPGLRGTSTPALIPRTNSRLVASPRNAGAGGEPQSRSINCTHPPDTAWL